VYSRTAPGGFDQLSATVDWPSTTLPPPDALRSLAFAQVVDGASGDVMWHGRLDDPGPRLAQTSTRFRLAATGEQAILDTIASPLLYVDRALESWVWVGDFSDGAVSIGDGTGFADNVIDVNVVDLPTGDITLSIPEGSNLPAGFTMTVTYRPRQYLVYPGTPQYLAWVFYSYFSNTLPAEVIEMVTSNGVTSETVQSTSWSLSQVDHAGESGFGSWTLTDVNLVSFRVRRTGAATVNTAGDDITHFANHAVYGTRVDQFGAAKTINDSAFVNPAQIMQDVVGRLLKGNLEIGNTLLMAGTPAINQAAWFLPVTPREVFAFLEQYAPDYWWAVLEPGDTGLPRFEFRPWTTTPVRYMFTPSNSTANLEGGGGALANVALVYYLRGENIHASVKVTALVPDLADNGLTRTMVVDVTDRGPVSSAVATQLGTDALNLTNTYRVNGTITVHSPVLDLISGRTVQPWEIIPGWPVQVMHTTQKFSKGFAFNTPDAQTVFRATGVTYRADQNTCEVTLDGKGVSLLGRRPALPSPVVVRPGSGHPPPRSSTPRPAPR
jgi:hypothetical protein